MRVKSIASMVLLLFTIASCGESVDLTAGTPETNPTATPAGTAEVSVPSRTPASTPTPTPSPDRPVDPCELVTKAEAEQLVKTKVDDAVTAPERCAYTGPVTGPLAQVEVYVGDGAKKYLDIERALEKKLRTLSGIGDEAYATDEAVFVHKSNLWVAVRMVRLNDAAENRKPLEDVARRVADRI